MPISPPQSAFSCRTSWYFRSSSWFLLLAALFLFYGLVPVSGRRLGTGWTTNLDTIKRSVDWQLQALQTDYIDFGFLHCIDEISDQHKVEKEGVGISAMKAFNGGQLLDEKASGEEADRNPTGTYNP